MRQSRWSNTLGASALAVLLIVSTGAALQGVGTPATHLATDAQAFPTAAKTPLVPPRFEPNLGQAPDEILFVAHLQGRILDLHAHGLSEGESTLQFPGAQAEVRLEGLEKQEAHSNYFMGDRSIPNVPHYGKVAYRGLYPGIDMLVYVAEDGNLEFDFIVAPGADPSQIRLDAEDGPLALQSDGGLALPSGPFHVNAPVSYQTTPNGPERVASRFALDPSGDAVVVLGPYDQARALIIDPRLGYSSYFGGTGGDAFLAVDSHFESGTWYVYALGTSYSSSSTRCTPLIACPAAYGISGTGAAVAKFRLDVDGTSALQWVAIVAGAVFPTDIDVDDTGVYLTGTGYPGLPISANAYQTKVNGNPVSCSSGLGSVWSYEAFLTVLDLSGSSLLYSSYIGGDATERASGVAAGNGHPVITGTTQWINSRMFPYLNGFQAQHNGPAWSPLLYPTCGSGIQTAGYDAFVARFDIYAAPNPGGAAAGGNPSSLLWSTFAGSAQDDSGADVAIDANDKVWVTGPTSALPASAIPFPVAGTPYQAVSAGGTDTFLLRLSATGSLLEYGTLMGGTGSDSPNGLFMANGNVYLAGSTDSGAGFDFNGPAYQTSGGGASDAYVSIFDALTGQLVKSTLLGRTGSDSGLTAQVDDNGDVVLAGMTSSGATFPRLHAWPNLHGGATDLFAARFSPDLRNLRFSTAIGSSGNDEALRPGTLVGTGSAATDIVLVGGWGADWPIARSASNPNVLLPALDSFHRSPSGGGDGVLARFTGTSVPFVACGPTVAGPYYRGVPITLSWAPPGMPHTQGIETYDAIAATDTNYGMDMTTFTWDFGDGSTLGPGNFPTPSHTYATSLAVPTTRTVTLTVKDTDGRTGSTSCTVTLVNRPPVAQCGTASASPFAVGVPVAFNGAGSTDGDGSVTSYAWTFSGGSPATSSQAEPSSTWSTPGTYTVRLVVTDNEGGVSLPVTCIVTLIDTPAVPDSYRFNEDQPHSFDVRTNDVGAYPIVAHTEPAKGNLTGPVGGTFTYAPHPDANGADSFTYTLQDPSGAEFTATVRIDINPVNDAPSFVFARTFIRADPEAGPYVGPGSAAEVSPGPVAATDEAVQAIVFSTTLNTNPSLFTELPTLQRSASANGTDPAPIAGEWGILRFQVTGTFGSATVCFVAQDNGGTASATDGFNPSLTVLGVDTSVPQCLEIFVNQPPVAYFQPSHDPAEPDQHVGFDPCPTPASACSQDYDGTITRYSWDFGDGSTSDLPHPFHTFVVPGIYAVRLTVFDDWGKASAYIHEVNVAWRSPPPIEAEEVGQRNAEPLQVHALPSAADAGPDLTVPEGTFVQLQAAQLGGQGSASWQWRQVRGSVVDLLGSASPTATFTAPMLSDGRPLDLMFSLRATEANTESIPDYVIVHVVSANQAPLAVASGIRSMPPGADVVLDASGSRDPDGDELSYKWEQLGGPTVELSDPESVRPTFQAPHGLGILQFRLRVSDGRAESFDDVEVELYPAPKAVPDRTLDEPMVRAEPIEASVSWTWLGYLASASALLGSALACAWGVLGTRNVSRPGPRNKD